MEPQVFELKTPFLKQGSSHKVVAATDLMSVALKYYHEGGENALHTHPGEDHSFLILDGEMTLYDVEDKVTVLKKGQGIMIPSGWYYWFKNSGAGPLIFLKFSAFKKEIRGKMGITAGSSWRPGLRRRDGKKPFPSREIAGRYNRQGLPYSGDSRRRQKLRGALCRPKIRGPLENSAAPCL